MPTKEQQHWDIWNADRVRLGLVNERLGLHEAVLKEFEKLKLPVGSKLLDIGCGAGWNASMLKGRYDYLGIDLGPASIEAARNLVPEAKFEVADFLAWSAPSEAYDAVLCIDAVAYFRDQDEALHKIAASLKPNGWLVMSTLNPFVYSRMSWIGPPGEGQTRKWLTRAGFHSLLQRNGLKVLRSKTILPDGDSGILRWTNAHKTNRLLGLLCGERNVPRIKECFGLGQFRIAVAQKSQG